MENGIISLKELYDYVKQNDREGIGLRNIRRNGYNDIDLTEKIKRIRKEMDEIAKKITENITSKFGLYLWGKYDKKKKNAECLWMSIYVGRTTKQGLKTRILDGLTKEREFLWECVLLEKQILLLLQQHYGWNYQWDRVFRKMQATHIIWCESPVSDESQIKDIEKDLIETLRPTANVQNTVPPDNIDGIYVQTSEIISIFRKHIHKNRQNGFNIYLNP